MAIFATSIPSEISIQRLNNDREAKFQLLQGPHQRNLRTENINYYDTLLVHREGGSSLRVQPFHLPLVARSKEKRLYSIKAN